MLLGALELAAAFILGGLIGGWFGAQWGTAYIAAILQAWRAHRGPMESPDLDRSSAPSPPAGATEMMGCTKNGKVRPPDGAPPQPPHRTG